jgi:hypothetical protein
MISRPCLVGVGHRSVDAVAEPELFGEMERQITGSQAEAVGPREGDDPAFVVFFEWSFNFGFEA